MVPALFSVTTESAPPTWGADTGKAAVIVAPDALVRSPSKPRPSVRTTGLNTVPLLVSVPLTLTIEPAGTPVPVGRLHTAFWSTTMLLKCV